MKKALLSILLALTLCLGAVSPALAFDDSILDPYYEFRGQDFVIRDGVLEKYIGDGGDVVIPETVKSIYSYAFLDCTNVTSVTLPSSLEDVGHIVFSGCDNLRKIVFPTSGKMVEKWAAMDSAKFCESILSTRHITHTEYNEYGLPSLVAYNVVPLPALEEIVNCPNKMLLENRDKNEALLSGWINPGHFVITQNERITSLSNQICAGKTGDYDKAKAIFEWVATNIEYDYDYYYSHHIDKTVTTLPEEVLGSKLSVCDGYSRLTQALLQAQGIPALFIGGTASGSNGWPRDGKENHAWNAALIDGEWIYIDSTWGRSAEEQKVGSEFTLNPTRFDESVLMFSRDHVGGTIYADPNAQHYTSSAYSASADDTPSGWAQGETWEAICSGLAPNDLQAAYRSNITREEFCRLMVNLVEQKTGKSISAYLSSKGLTASAPFSDTSSAEVAAAYALGIVNGVSATSFNPSGSISRQEAAAMLTRTAKLLGIAAGAGEAFADAGEASPWAGESIAFISGVTDPTTGGKVMGGTGDGNFSPWGSYTREQAIMTALRLFHCK